MGGKAMEQAARMNERITEAQIIEACQAGDRDAFRWLFERYKDRVYSIAYHFSNNEAMARDVTQQVFLKLFTVIAQFRRDAEFATWLYRIVANACTDEQRKRRRFVPFDPKMEASHVTTRSAPEDAIHRRQVAASVREAIAALSPKLRLPILLKYVEGLSYEEIAAALNCSIGTVSSRLNRGHKQLAARLEHLRGDLFGSE
jgi:RNA polymerase sigma-70 factor (ECF subfamily)